MQVFLCWISRLKPYQEAWNCVKSVSNTHDLCIILLRLEQCAHNQGLVGTVGLIPTHVLSYRSNSAAFNLQVTFTNHCNQDVTI